MAEIWTMGELLVEIMRPEAGTDLDREGLFRGPFPSGAPAIFADTAARLGHGSGIIGGVGRDGFGKCLLERLRSDGVDCRFVAETDEVSTGVAFVTYFADGSRKYLFHMGNSAAVCCEAPDFSELDGIKFFHVMGCSTMCERRFGEKILRLTERAAAAGVRISFDPNVRTELLHDASVLEAMKRVYENTAVFLPGEEELLLISGEDTLEKAVARSFRNPGLEVLALKQGSRGCTVYTRDGQIIRQPVYPVDAVDPTGAGDCFDAGFLCGLLEGRDIRECAQMAAAAGALNTAAFGPMEGRISAENVRRMIAGA